MRNTPKKASSTMLRLLAVTTSIALVGAYVAYRVLRADPRKPDAVATSPAAAPVRSPPGTVHMPAADPEVGPALGEPEPAEDLAHLGGSKSLIGVVQPRDVGPKPILPPPPAPAPQAPQR